MKILFDNVNFESRSGPNSFGKKLADEINIRGYQVQVKPNSPDVQLSFIMATAKHAPTVQRLDGIYFNTAQDYSTLNAPIQETYREAECVIFQSRFNEALTKRYFGEHDDATVIHNGTDLDAIEKISPVQIDVLDKFENVWCCASSWRPHKRLKENIRYFLDARGDNDCLVVAGSNPDYHVNDSRIFYLGDVLWPQLVSLYKRSKYFLHLAWLDHCPNVVIDARAAGCHIICSSSGGTEEIAGNKSTVIIEDSWDFTPTRLYEPPVMDFSLTRSGLFTSEIDIVLVADRYCDVLERAISSSTEKGLH
jgi:glycosyltransferase involved in cell wall biosynthesis